MIGSVETGDLHDAAMRLDAESRAFLREHVHAEGRRFRFFQAVRLLDRLILPPVRPGEMGRLADEPIRFRSFVSFTHPTREVEEVQRGHTFGSEAEATIVATFFGVVGPLGAGTLPAPYAELLLERLREGRDSRLLDFFDLFNHRLLGQFYRAWSQRRAYVVFEQGRARRAKRRLEGASGPDRVDARDWVTRAMRSVVGLGDELDTSGGAFGEDALLRFAGVLGLRARPGQALEALLEEYFGIRAELQPLRGRWCRIEPEDVTILRSSAPAILGETTVLGEMAWDPAGAFRLRLGPLDFRTFQSFLPGGSAAAALRSITRYFCGLEQAAEVQLVLRRDQVPSFSLTSDDPSALDSAAPRPLLGWSTWLGAEGRSDDSDDTVFDLEGAAAEATAA